MRQKVLGHEDTDDFVLVFTDNGETRMPRFQDTRQEFLQVGVVAGQICRLLAAVSLVFVLDLRVFTHQIVLKTTLFLF